MTGRARLEYHRYTIALVLTAVVQDVVGLIRVKVHQLLKAGLVDRATNDSLASFKLECLLNI